MRWGLEIEPPARGVPTPAAEMRVNRLWPRQRLANDLPAGLAV